jgi:sugar lactone lactonase YvrE
MRAIEPLGTPAYELAEGPVWTPSTRRASWVDIEQGLILSAHYDGQLGAITTIPVGEVIGCAIPVEGGRYLCGLESQVALVHPDGTMRRSRPLIPGGRRFNDGKIDPQGRLVIGSLRRGGADGQQHLLRFEVDGGVTTIDDDLNLSNGLGWSPDGAWFYNADTHDEVIYRRSYGRETLGRREAFIKVDGRPDGITVDATGRIWVTVFNRGRVAVFDPDGSERPDLQVSVGDMHPASVEFVGDELSDLLIVTGYPRTPSAHALRAPGDGELFIVRSAAKGLLPTSWTETPLPL